MKQATQDPTKIKRRGFLSRVVKGICGMTAVGLSTQIAAAEPPAVAEPSKPGSTGYHETDHIRNYYKSAAL